MGGTKNKGNRLSVAKTYKLFIGGAFPRTESGRYYQMTNQRGEFVANYCRASRKDFRNSMVVARKALDNWWGRSAFNRGQIMYRMAEMLESRRAGFEALLKDVAGFSDKAAAAEVDTSIDRLVWYAGWTDKFAQVFGSTNPVASPHFNFSMPEPVGVVAAFVSQSSPLLGIISAMAPLIAGGNTCILMVDNSAPVIAIELAEVLVTSDLPGGVVNILTTQGDELISHVGSHMDVDAVALYGRNAEIRKSLQLLASESVKRVKFFDDPNSEGWIEESQQSPYRILPFVEFKTAWHPLGA